MSAGGGVEYTTPTNLSATFTDANLGISTSDFSGTINWGDGHTTPFASHAVTGSGGSYTVGGSHQYAEDGTYSVIIVINDQGGSTTTDTGSATVADAPLTAGTVESRRRCGIHDAREPECDLHKRSSRHSDQRLLRHDQLGRRPHNAVYLQRGYRQRRELYGKWLSPVRGRWHLQFDHRDQRRRRQHHHGHGQYDGGRRTPHAWNGQCRRRCGIHDAREPECNLYGRQSGRPTSDFSGTINWGDGHTTPFTSSAVTGSGGSYTVSGSHQYAEDGTYSVIIAINDEGGNYHHGHGQCDGGRLPPYAWHGHAAGGGVEYTTPTNLIATFTDANLGAS